MTNRKLFKEYMTALGEVFDKKISKALADVYWRALEPFSDDDCRIMFDKAITSCKFFPKPAELIDILNANKPSLEDRSLVIANEILDHVRTVGSKERPPILKSDPVADYLMTARWPFKSWAENHLEAETKWWVKEFCESYRATLKSDIQLRIEDRKNILRLVEGIG